MPGIPTIHGYTPSDIFGYSWIKRATDVPDFRRNVPLFSVGEVFAFKTKRRTSGAVLYGIVMLSRPSNMFTEFDYVVRYFSITDEVHYETRVSDNEMVKLV